MSRQPSSSHFVPERLRQCHQRVARRIAWPYSFENDILMRWRANILASILMAGLAAGVFAFTAAAMLIVRQNAWELALVDTLGLGLGLVFLSVRSIRYEVRAGISVLMFYVIGMAIVLSVGPLSGGPAWLFAFAVMAGILMGNRAALGAILVNVVSIVLIGWLISSGRWGQTVVFFSSTQAMIAAGVNFIFLNTLTAVGVATLVQGLSEQFQERQSAQRKLQENRELLALITRHTSALISIHDSTAQYIYASPSHEKLGYYPGDLIGQSGFTLIAPDDMDYLKKFFEKPIAEKTPSVHLNYRLKDINGNVHYYRGSFDAVYSPEGSLERIICVGEDITEIRRIEQEKIEALTLAAENQKLALVGQIAGKMAHDFNNILGIIMGTAEMAQMDCPHPPTTDALKLIFDQTVRGKNLTRNLVAFAKDQEPKQEHFRVQEKIDLVLTLLKKDLDGIDVRTEYGPDLPLLPADPGMSEHALVNLVQNAVHAVSRTPVPWISIRVRQKETWMVIEVSDNGCGIPAEFMDRVFEPAFTLKGSKDVQGMYEPGIKGTGYGLANVKRYVAQHRGTIDIQSSPEKGTTVRIDLPISDNPAVPQKKEG